MTTASSSNYLVSELRHLIADHFTLAEIQLLAADTGINYEELGEGGKSVKIQALLAQAQSSSLLERLVEVARQERPFLPWPAAAETDIPCPYRGLFAFREEDAHLFFGREAFTEQLLGIVNQKALTAVIGPSGSGKSSVIFAGLIPELRKQGKWNIMQMRPGNHPFSGLATALLPFYAPELNETDRLLQSRKLAHVLQDGSLTLAEVISLIEQKQTETSQTMLIIDQFEELYTLTPETEREQFLDIILQTNQSAPSILKAASFRLLLTLRADFMGHVLAHPLMVNALQNSDVKLGPMDNDALRRVIEEPAKLAGVRFETGLVDRIIDDVGGENNTLPLLEFALTELWKWQSNRELSHVAYEKTGQVRGALALHAEQVFASLTPEQQEQARRIMVQLVQPGRGVADTRRVAQRSELEHDWELVQHLAGVRLLVTNQEEDDQTAEVIHEALIQRWDKLQNWMNEDRAFRQWQERLRFSLQYYEEIEHDEGALLRGAPLAEAEAWLKERFDDVSDEEVDFVLASARYRDREQEEREAEQRQALELAEQLAREQSERADTEAKIANRTGRFAWALGLAMLVALGAVLFTYALNTVSHTRAVAGQAQIAYKQQNYEQAMRLALDARQRFLDEAFLHSLFNQNRERIYFNSNEVLLEQIPLEVIGNATDLIGHTFVATDVAWSASDRLATLAGDIIIWDLDTNEPAIVLSPQEGRFGEALAWSPDEEQIAVVGASRDVIEIVDVETAVVNQFLEGHADVIHDLAWSDEGQLASASVDGAVIIWNIATGEPEHLLEEHTDAVFAIAWSDDGRLASASADTTAIVWNGTTGEPMRRLSGQHTDGLNAVAWSNEGLLATGGNDLSVLVWDLSGDDPPLRLEGHGDGISSVAWSPQGTLASASFDGSIILWDLEAALPAMQYRNTIYDIEEIAWSSDRRLAAANLDEIITVFDVNVDRSAKTLKENDSAIQSVAWSPSGILAAGSKEPWINLYIPHSVVPEARLEAHSSGVSALDWNVFNQLASGSNDNLVIVWDSDGEWLYTLPGHDDPVLAVAWSPAGELASGGADGQLIVWNLAASEPAQVMGLSERGGIKAVDWSPAGELASGDTNGQVVLWDVDTGEARQILAGHDGPVTAVAWSPLGQLASGSIDGSLIVWDLAEGEPMGVLSRPEEADALPGVTSLVWSPDGRLVSGSTDGRIITWDVEAGTAVQTLREKSFPVTSLGWSFQEQLAAGYPDGTISLISDFSTRQPCGWLSRNYSQEEWIQVHSQLRIYEKICDNLPTPPLNINTLTWRGRIPDIALAVAALVAFYFLAILIWNYVKQRLSGMRPGEAIYTQQQEIFERLRGLTTRETAVVEER